MTIYLKFNFIRIVDSSRQLRSWFDIYECAELIIWIVRNVEPIARKDNEGKLCPLTGRVETFYMQNYFQKGQQIRLYLD